LACTEQTIEHHGLSEEEHLENAVLRSRIDKQSQLIMTLKQRLDEATQSADLLDKHNTSLTAECEHARDDIAVQMRRCEMIESRFNDLSSNHRQMIEASLLCPLLLTSICMQ